MAGYTYYEKPPEPHILDKIAQCESSGRQFNPNGTVLHGRIDYDDIGKWQINRRYWEKKADELGYNIYTLEGNRDMAYWIYDNYGTQPWNASKYCWDVLE